MKPHQLSLQQIAKNFRTDTQNGLSEVEAQHRKESYGPNTLPEVPPKTWLAIFFSQFQSPLTYILLVAAVIIFFAGPDTLDAFIISGVLLFNSVIGTIQEGRVSNILASLKRFIKSDCIVIRDGQRHLVEDKDLVLGDVIFLQGGQRIPADARIIESNNLQVDEAVLTGESLSISKVDAVIEADVQINQQRNMLFRGTYLLSGTGKAVVVATGLDTQVGKIHKAVEELETDMPLKKELNRLSYWILFFILILCILLFVVGLLMGKPIRELLVMLTALFICVVPEGLPVVLTLALVSGVYRLAKQNVLVKRMQAVEGLGRTEVIITDKTGTLTRNEMIVSKIFVDGRLLEITGAGYHAQGEILYEGKPFTSLSKDSPLVQIGIASCLLNTTDIEYDIKTDLFTIKGDPTEAAMSVFSQKLDLSLKQLEKEYKKIFEIPFDSRWKYHAGFYEKDGNGKIFVAGSVETILERSLSVAPEVKEILPRLLDRGLRVIAVAMKDLPLEAFQHNNQEPTAQFDFFAKLIETDLTFLGLCGIEDSIRSEVRDIIDQARDTGIRVVMATGDHQKTALYVAKKVGIFKEGDAALDGSEFERLTDAELVPRLDTVTVYSRVSPDHKFKLVNLFKSRGFIVAMTGDGVNDAPSLVAADLGIAMGQIGTEVAKEASDIVLLDDSFVNIINAVEQGRHIFYTLRRVVLYFFATNMGEVLIVLFALVAGFPLPLTAAQILWLNLVTDGFMDVALSTEPKEKGLLRKRWLERRMRLVDTNILLKMFYVAIPMALGSLWIFNRYYQTNLALARTMTLIVMAMFQWFNAWNCRSERFSLFQIGLFTNKWLIITSVFVLILQFLLLYTPWMQHIFKTVPLSAEQWHVIVLLTFPIIMLDEVRKWVVRRWVTKA